ncbi:MAG: hypothetical protein HQK49_01880 [Oligoflexia bacterium]|nr:hypothetical protein [Oligoflexia bacterium]
MKYKLLIFTTLMALSAEALCMADVSPHIGSRLTFGVGYDSVSGGSAGTCVEVVEAKPISQGMAAVSAELKYIEDYKSLAESLNISSTTNLKIGIPGYNMTVNGTAEFFKQQKIEEHSVYFMIKIIVASPVEKMSSVKLKESYVSMLKGSDGASTFRERCGDEYVVGLQKGGALYALTQVKTKSEEEKKALEITIRAKVGSFINSASSMKSALDLIVKDKQITTFIYQEGGLIDNIPFSLNDIGLLFEHAKVFAKNIRENGGGTPILSITESYKFLDNYPREASPIRVSQKQKIVESLSNQRYNALGIINRLEYILGNQELYLLNDKLIVELNATRDQYAKNLDIIANLADDCFYDIEKCRLPLTTDGFVLAKVPEVNTKNSSKFEEKNCLEWLYKEKEDAICGVAHFNKARKEVCGVELFKQGNGSVCGVAGFKRGRSEAICGVELYNERKGSVCGNTDAVFNGSMYITTNNPNHPIPDPSFTCSRAGYDGGYAERGTFSDFTNTLEYRQYCFRFKTCRHESFGPEIIRECEHPSFGVIYNTCRHENFGPELFKECEHENFGVASNKSCRNEKFGKEKCLKWQE